MKTNAQLSKCLEGSIYGLDCNLKDILEQSMIHHAVEGLQFVKRILNEAGEDVFIKTRALLPIVEDYFAKMEDAL